jgi:hypothetical protein
VTNDVVRARVCGGVIAGLAGVVGVLLAMPASWSDYPERYPGFRLGQALTPYPLMLPAVIALLAGAGLLAVFLPKTARVAAVAAALAGLQVGGIAVVARRDWWNYAGADGASYTRADAGSLLALAMAVVAALAVVVSVLLYRTVRGRHRPHAVQVAGGIVAGLVVMVVVPAMLCAHWNYTNITAAGQFALWWSVPWGLGLVAAGTVPDSPARQSAVWSVLASVLLAAFCLAAPSVFGFGVRLPD